jgi:hypothetical protein
MCKVHHSYCTEREGRPAERRLGLRHAPWWVLQSIAVKYDALAAEQIGNRLDAFVIVNFHDAHPVWIASLLRSDMIFRRDRCALRWREAVQISSPTIRKRSP